MDCDSLPWQNGAWQLMTDNGRGASEFYPQEMFTGQRFVADGQWHHLVTYDDATGERLLYVDRELDAEGHGKGEDSGRMPILSRLARELTWCNVSREP